MTLPELPTEQAARAALVAAAAALGPAGLNVGRAGNLSLRWHRGARDGLLLTPSALDCATLREDDLVWLPLDAQTAAGSGEEPPFWSGHHRPSSEWRLHHDIQHGLPRARAVIHVHAPHATTLACLPAVQRDGIPPFHYMIAVAGGDSIPCVPYAPFGSAELAASAAAALVDRRACLLANHGLVVAGATLAQAFELAVDVEWLCRVYWQALQVGGPSLLDAARMEDALERYARYREAAPDAGAGSPSTRAR